MNYSIIGNPTLGLVLLCLRMAFIIPSFLPSLSAGEECKARDIG
jgi:hypothetical protein